MTETTLRDAFPMPLATVLATAEQATETVWTLAPPSEQALNYSNKRLALHHGACYADRTGETVDMYRNGQFFRKITPKGKATFDD